MRAQLITRTLTHARVRAHKQTHTDMHTLKQAHNKPTHICTQDLASAHTHAHKEICAQRQATRAHTHTRTHTRAHTLTQKHALFQAITSCNLPLTRISCPIHWLTGTAIWNILQHVLRTFKTNKPVQMMN